MNAFTFEMIDAWHGALQQCRTDEAVKVVVVTGAGNAFCSGGDIVAKVMPDDEFVARVTEGFRKLYAG